METLRKVPKFFNPNVFEAHKRNSVRDAFISMITLQKIQGDTKKTVIT